MVLLAQPFVFRANKADNLAGVQCILQGHHQQASQ